MFSHAFFQLLLHVRLFYRTAEHPYRIKSFPSDNLKLAETEFHLVANALSRQLSSSSAEKRITYLNNPRCAADPFIIIAACCYVAGKAEESPNPVGNAIAGARLCLVVRSVALQSIHTESNYSHLII